LLELFTGQQGVKQPSDLIVGAVYWLAECQTTNRLLLELFTGQQGVKQPSDLIVGAVYWFAGCDPLTDFIFGAVYWSTGCETANRLYCWCCLLVSRM